MAAHPSSYVDLAQLTSALEALRAEASRAEKEFASAIAELAPDARVSARNLAHYTGIRRHDLRPLQDELASIGLSSLGRMEAHVLPTLDAVLAAVRQMQSSVTAHATGFHRRFVEGTDRLAAHADQLLGAPPAERATRIMVTMPPEAASDAALVRQLLEAGMGVMRINCAHDGPEAWRAMAGHLHQARAETGLECRILMDLGGPKLRTGAMRDISRPLRLKPGRDRSGAVLAPMRFWLVPEGSPETTSPDTAPVVMTKAAPDFAPVPGDRLRLRDARGRRRRLRVVEVRDGAVAVECSKGLRLEDGLACELQGPDGPAGTIALGPLPTVPDAARLEPGDTLLLTADPAPGRDAVRDAAGAVVEAAVLPCTLPEVFPDVRPGERVLFDDGRIDAVVEHASDGVLELRVTRAAPGGSRLAGDKGINLPDTALRLPPLTPRDLADLDVVVGIADLVGMSFVRAPDDVRALRAALAERGAAQLGVMLKIETRDAFDHLPHILLAGLGPSPLGVMVARGDLAVEIGFERLAEVQEEILWFCEAAHVPVVWATQVLDTLAHKGAPSRAEVTDAAMGGRAECVMLNKGPHVVEAVRFLGDVLARMQAHQHKKSSMLRALHVSG